MAHGVGLRRQHFDSILEHHPGVDFFEILPENFMRFGGRPRDILKRAADSLPIVIHGTALSIGGPDPLSERYLDELEELIRLVRPPWFSDHLCYSSAHGVEYFDLIPLPFTEEVVAHVVDRVKAVQDRMGIPFLVENPSYYVKMPGAEMTEAEFVHAIVTRADCGLLLDVNNVFVNATNHGYDPRAYVDAMPRGRVLQYHMAGHFQDEDVLIDTHGAAVRQEVLDLYEYTLGVLGPAWTLLEWDNNIPPLDDLLAENDRVRASAERGLA